MRCLFGACWTDMAVDPGEAAGVRNWGSQQHFKSQQKLIQSDSPVDVPSGKLT